MTTWATDPVETTTGLLHEPGHRDLAREGLTFPLRDQARAAALAQSLGGAAQGFEDTIHAQLTGGTLDNAIGADLDQWGELVGELRGALLQDDQYRPFVQARILANRCDGTPDKLLEVFKLVTGPTLKVEFLNLHPAGLILTTFRREWMTEPVRRRVRRTMESIAPAGRTFELWEAIAGSWGSPLASFTTPGGVPARVI